jgi:hypothetical protein
VISYGCKVPAGIFVPSMAIGASFGRMIGIMVKAVNRCVLLYMFCTFWLCLQGLSPKQWNFCSMSARCALHYPRDVCFSWCCGCFEVNNVVP